MIKQTIEVEGNASSMQSIDLPTGLYLVRITTKDEEWIKKIWVQ